MGGSTGTTGVGAGAELVLVGADNGVVVVPADTPLRRLNFFDGKFLRAEDLEAEQDYLRLLVQLSNRAGGGGIVNGFDTTLAGGGASVTVGEGLAVDPRGRVLLLPGTRTMRLDDLIAASAKVDRPAPGGSGPAAFGDCVVTSAPGATTSAPTGDLYLLTVGSVEALCGEEDVFGRLCEDACVRSKDRRWRMEGVVFRALPLQLRTPLRTTTAVPPSDGQLRSRVASAWFEDERLRVASLVRGESLRAAAAWGLGARAETGDVVPLAVFSRGGGVTRFLDAWTVRRERMEAPPRRYWSSRLAMRPWDVFLAQVLQFQAQLREALSGGEARGLLEAGILELPAAGYLPVDPTAQAAVNQQVRALVGAGLDLRFCIVTPDFVPHALELRQHMDRISLLDGLEHPEAKPRVDVLVPGGRLVGDPLERRGTAFRAVGTAPALFGEPARGAANGARRNATGGSFTVAGTSDVPLLDRIVALVRRLGTTEPEPAPAPAPARPVGGRERILDVARLAASRATLDRSAFGGAPPRNLRPLFDLAAANPGELVGAAACTAFVDADPFQLEVSSSTQLQLDLLLGVQGQARSLVRLVASGTLYVGSKNTRPGGIEQVTGTISASIAVTGARDGSPGQVTAWRYQLQRRQAPGTPSIVAGLLGEEKQPAFRFTFEWDGDPTTGKLRIQRSASREGLTHLATAAGTTPLLELDLAEDPAVLEPTESHHVLAGSALEILASMLPNGSDWQKATEAALFPAPEGGSESLRVLAERDWVLFARRRLDSCAEELVTPRAPDRRYHVYLREARGEEEAKAFVEQVVAPEGPPLHDLRFVGLVDFDGATHEPLDVAALRAALLPAKGQLLRYSVTASEYGGGLSAEARRRARLEQAIGDGLDVAGSEPLDRGALPARFQGRIDGGEPVHGIVVLVTVQPQVAVANAYGLEPGLGTELLFTHDATGALVVRDPLDLTGFPPERRKASLLAPVTFRAGTAEEGDLAKVVERWKGAGLRLAHVVRVTRGAEDDPAADAEARAIAGAIPVLQPAQAWSTHARAGFDEAPEHVNAMVFLVGGRAQQLRGRIALVKPDGVRILQPLLDEGKANEILESARLSRFVQLVDDAEYDPDSGALRNPEVVRRAWRGTIGDARPAAVLTFVPQDDRGAGDQIKAQVRSVAEAVGGDPAVDVRRAADLREPAAGEALPVVHFVVPRLG
jgi:hypothetical protein